jgi:hypothetical protein
MQLNANLEYVLWERKSFVHVQSGNKCNFVLHVLTSIRLPGGSDA